MPLRASAIEFLRYCTLERQLSPNTLQAYESDLRDFGNWLRSEGPGADVNSDTLKLYLAHMVNVKGLSAATVRRRLACLRAFYRRASELGQAPDAFADWRPKLPRRRRLPRTLSRTETMKLLSALARSDSGFGIGVRLMVCTGLRVGELCSVRADDVSPDGSTIRVRGKGSRDRVTYVTDPKLQLELTLLIKKRGEETGSGPALLTNRLGTGLTPQSIRTRLRRLGEEAGITRRLTPHMLRHTAATLLIETGVDIRFVQRLLGHSSIATTEIYTHVSDEALRKTLLRADLLASLVRA